MNRYDETLIAAAYAEREGFWDPEEWCENNGWQYRSLPGHWEGPTADPFATWNGDVAESAVDAILPYAMAALGWADPPKVAQWSNRRPNERLAYAAAYLA